MTDEQRQYLQQIAEQNHDEVVAVRSTLRNALDEFYDTMKFVTVKLEQISERETAMAKVLHDNGEPT